MRRTTAADRCAMAFGRLSQRDTVGKISVLATFGAYWPGMRNDLRDASFEADVLVFVMSGQRIEQSV